MITKDIFSFRVLSYAVH